LFDPNPANKNFLNCALDVRRQQEGKICTPYQTVNPFNGEVPQTFDEHTDQQTEQRLANADKTFRKSGLKSRAGIENALHSGAVPVAMPPLIYVLAGLADVDCCWPQSSICHWRSVC
jgi:hypothetical protein